MERKDSDRLRAQVKRQAREAARGCLLFRSRALSRRLTGFYDEALRPLGLKPTQMNVMTVVEVAGGDARLARIAEMISLEPSSLSRIVDVMRRNGWLETRPDPQDERARLIRLSEEGAALYAEAIPLWRKAQIQAREFLGDQGADLFTELANASLFGRAT